MLTKSGYLIARQRFGTSNIYEFNWSKGGKTEVMAIRNKLRTITADIPGMTETAIPHDEIVNDLCLNRQDGNDENVNRIHEVKTGNEDGNQTLCEEIYGPSSVSLSQISRDFKVADDAEDERLVARFRSIYPLRISEGRVPVVRAALQRALAIATADAILDGAMRYANECTSREAEHIADPVNWLNGRRWCSEEKIKSDVAILEAGNPLATINQTRPLSRRQQISQWKPSRKNRFSLQ